MATDRDITFTIPFETACILRSLIGVAVGGDSTENEARTRLDELDETLNAKQVPGYEFDCFFVAHVEMSRVEKAVRPAKRKSRKRT